MSTAVAKTTYPIIAKAFDLPDDIYSVYDLFRCFDFSKCVVSTSMESDFLSHGIAPSFGKISSDTIQKLDDELKVIISGTTKAIGDLKNKSWENVISTLQQNPLLEPFDQGIQRSDKLIKDTGVSFFKFDGSPDDAVVREVHTWFSNLVNDDDILASTGIDIHILADIVAATGSAVRNFETFFYADEKCEQTLIDVGVLRYPDIDQPYFKVYRLRLTAWRDCTRIIFAQSDKNGITGELNVRRYKPRDSVISGLKEETKKRAIEEAEALFA